MKENWLIVFAPESDFPADGDFEKLPAFPSETVLKALELCPILRRNGSAFEGAGISRLTISGAGVRYLHFDDVEDRFALAKVAEALARGVGPLTILNEDHLTVCGVKGGVAAELIAADLLNQPIAPFDRICGECRSPLAAGTARCQICGWSPLSGRRPSLDPPAFAPGAPPRKSALPPFRTMLFITGILGLLGVPAALHRGVRGMLGCDARPQEDVDPAVANTNSAMTVAHLYLEDGKAELSPEGWIVVPGAPSLVAYVVETQPDGRKLLCDGWKHPIRCVRRRGALTFTSLGPNGIDEKGKGDDIVKSFP